MRRWVIVSVAILAAVWLVPTAAIANDDVTADGDLTRPTNNRAFGKVCPGRTYGAAGNVSIRIQKKNLVFTNSFENGVTATISVAGTTPSGDGSNGVFTATIDGDGQLAIPTTWNAATTPFPESYRDKLTPAAVGSTVMLSIPWGAAAGSYSGLVSYSATGPGYSNNTPTKATITDTQTMSVTWTVDPLDPDCGPSITSAAFVAPRASCPAGGDNAVLRVEFTDDDLGAGSLETHDAAIDWDDDGIVDQTLTGVTSPLEVGHTYTAVGTHDASVTVTDAHGASDSATASVTVDYRVLDGGVRQPINMDGSSVFRYGSTVPVKIRFAACDGSIPTDLAPELSAVIASSSTPSSSVNENLASTSAADTGRVMRFSDGQWIYNLATSSLSDPSAKYRLTITVPATGQTVQVVFGLRS